MENDIYDNLTPNWKDLIRCKDIGLSFINLINEYLKYVSEVIMNWREKK